MLGWSVKTLHFFIVMLRLAGIFVNRHYYLPEGDQELPRRAVSRYEFYLNQLVDAREVVIALLGQIAHAILADGVLALQLALMGIQKRRSSIWPRL